MLMDPLLNVESFPVQYNFSLLLEQMYFADEYYMDHCPGLLEFQHHLKIYLLKQGRSVDYQ